MQDRNHRIDELWRVAPALGIGALLGLAFGQVGWFVAAALAIYLGWVIAELIKLHRWLASGSGSEPPDSFGLWGEIFDSIYRLQKREQTVRADLQSIIDRARDSVIALRDAVVIIDRDGLLEWWNPAGERLLGFTTPKDTKQPVTNLMRDPRFRRYLDAGDYSQVLEIPSPISDDMTLQVQLTVFGNGDRLMIARDVTRMYQLELTRRDFVANVSHELKTPLTVIKGYLETLDTHLTELPPKFSRALVRMTEQSERMERLVDDLLLLSRLENTEPDPSPARVAVKALLERIRNDVEAATREKGHTFTVHVENDFRLLGTEPELHSAIANIVLNAAKYTDPNGRIDIRAWRDTRGAHIAVKDSGLGIEPRHIPRLTERFYRTDKGRSVAEGGTGLGLAIVKHALKRHDATLEIQSEYGKGSTFTCHFPPDRAAA